MCQLDGPNAVFMNSSLKYKILHLLRRELKEKGKMKIYHFRTHLITKLPQRFRNFSSLWRNSTSFRKNQSDKGRFSIKFLRNCAAVVVIKTKSELVDWAGRTKLVILAILFPPKHCSHLTASDKSYFQMNQTWLKRGRSKKKMGNQFRTLMIRRSRGSLFH